MNIFVLDDKDFQKCARYHIDRHVVKMILETTQLLNNAMIIHDVNYVPVYKPTHLKHSVSIWTSQSAQNFEWLCRLGLALSNEYTYRYGKVHKCESIIRSFYNGKGMLSMPDIGITPFAKCMPDQYKVDDPVESYRNYYRADKAYIAKWTKREIPEWWNNV